MPGPFDPYSYGMPQIPQPQFRMPQMPAPRPGGMTTPYNPLAGMNPINPSSAPGAGGGFMNQLSGFLSSPAGGAIGMGVGAASDAIGAIINRRQQQRFADMNLASTEAGRQMERAQIAPGMFQALQNNPNAQFAREAAGQYMRQGPGMLNAEALNAHMSGFQPDASQASFYREAMRNLGYYQDKNGQWQSFTPSAQGIGQNWASNWQGTAHDPRTVGEAPDPRQLRDKVFNYLNKRYG